MKKLPKRRNEDDEKEYNDTKSKLEELPKFEKENRGTNIGIRIVKNRGGVKDREPRYLGLDRENLKWRLSIIEDTQTQQKPEALNWKLMSDEEKDRIIIDAYEKGKTTQETADMIGRCKSTVEQRLAALRKAGRLTLRKKHPKKPVNEGENNSDTQNVKTDN